MALAVAHHQSGIQPSQIPGSITLGWTPTAGNLIIVFMHTNLFTAGITVNTTDWTAFDTATLSTLTNGMALYRYAQIGDTSALPVLWTAGTTYWAYDVFEISGASGVFATDVQAHNATTLDAVSSLTSASIATGANNALAICGAGQYNGTHDPTLDAAWTLDESQHNASNYGSTAAGEQTVPSSGTSVSATVNFGGSNSTGEPNDLFLVVLSATTSASVTLTGAQSAATAHAVTPSTGHTSTLTGVSATAHAGPVKPSPRANPAGVAAAGVARGLTPTHAPVLRGVSAIATMGVILARGDPGALQASATGVAGQVGLYATPIAYLPAARIMRNRAVPAEGAMDDTAVAVVARLYPSGPRPVSRAVTLAGAAAVAQAHPVQVLVQAGVLIQQASSLCQAGSVTTSIT